MQGSIAVFVLKLWIVSRSFGSLAKPQQLSLKVPAGEVKPKTIAFLVQKEVQDVFLSYEKRRSHEYFSITQPVAKLCCDEIDDS